MPELVGLALAGLLVLTFAAPTTAQEFATIYVGGHASGSSTTRPTFQPGPAPTRS